MAKGREKVHLAVDVLHVGFGLLLVEQFAGLKISKQLRAIEKTLGDFKFPVLNFVFSAAGKLRTEDENDLVVKTRLDELELRATVTASVDNGETEVPVKTIGLLPWQTITTKTDASMTKFAPSMSVAKGIWTAGLSMVIPAFFRPRADVLYKPFMGSANEFGWYLKSNAQKSSEGIHHTAAVLQVGRAAQKLAVRGKLATDWIGDHVDNQTEKIDTTIDLDQTDSPKSLTLMDTTDLTKLPLVIPQKVVVSLLGETAVEDLVSNEKLLAFDGPDGTVITRASLIKLLGE